MRAPAWFAVACFLACGTSGTPSGSGSNTDGGIGNTGPSTDGGPSDAGNPQPTRYTLKVDVTGQGTVLSTPAGIDCPQVCAAQYDASSTVSLIAKPTAGFHFEGWGIGCSGPGGCDLSMKADTEVWATFVADPPPAQNRTLTVSVSGDGRVTSSPSGIDCPSTCSASFIDGSRVNLTATPAAGSSFTRWGGACSGSGDCSVQMGADSHVDAVFDSAPPPSPYVVSELPPVESISNLFPTSINFNGDVVGSYTTDPGCCGRLRAFFYDASTGTARRILDDGTSSQVPLGIDDSRQVAASVITDGTATTRQRGVRWENDQETDIGALPPGPNGKQSGATAINALGWIAGWSLGDSNWQRAVLWDGAKLRDLGSGTGTWSYAYGINGSGVVVGQSPFPNSIYPNAALFEKGTVRDLGNLGGAGSYARAINDAGRIVGSSFLPLSSTAHAIVYDLPAGPMRDVSPTLPCELSAVNSSGVAVGTCAPAKYVIHGAILRGAVVEDLNDIVGDPSWVLGAARGINDKGQITGSGQHNGQPRAYVLTPR